VDVVFFYNEKHQRPEKISWDQQRILTVNAISHEIFSGRFVLFVVKKKGHLAGGGIGLR
jgi:hypothetical protein